MITEQDLESHCQQQSLSTATVLFRATFTRTITSNLLMKNNRLMRPKSKLSVKTGEKKLVKQILMNLTEYACPIEHSSLEFRSLQLM